MVYFLLCYLMQFTWRHPCRSFRIPFSCVILDISLGATLGGLRGFLLCWCTLGASIWCWCCLVRYRCVTDVVTWSVSDDTFCLSWRHPLCMLVDYCSIDFGMMLNKSARIINAAWCMSFIVASGAFGVGFCNASTQACDDSVSAPEDKTLGILTCWGVNSTSPEIIFDLVYVANTL